MAERAEESGKMVERCWRKKLVVKGDGGRRSWLELEEREKERGGEDTLTVRFSTSAIEWAKHRHVMATLRARHKLFPKRDEPKWSYTDVSIREILTLPIRNMT